jgi:hypothetical protein
MGQKHKVFDQCQHIATTVADMSKVFAHRIVDDSTISFSTLRQDIDKSVDGVQWRPEFMTDVVQEG